MSAWIVSPAHIAQLVEGGIRLGVIERRDALKTGRMLTNANKRSIRARYGKEDRDAEGVKAYWHERPLLLISDASLLKQLNCYDYQTCEFDGYERSSAKKFVTRLELMLAANGITRHSAGYDDAPWGI